MNFKIERKILQEAIGKVSKAITGKMGNPILDGMYIKANENTLTFIGSDGDTTINTSIAAEVTANGEIIIEPRIFGEIIRKLPEGEVSVSVTDNQFQIKCLKSEYNLVCNTAEEYPSNVIEQAVNSDVVLELEQAKLKNLVRSVYFAAADSEARPILKGILLEAKNGVLNLVALDGYRLAKKSLELDTEIEASAIIDAKLFNDISKLFKDTNDIVSVYIGNNQTTFKFDETTVTLRRMEGNFVAYESLIPTEAQSVIELNRKSFIEAISRVSVMSDNNNHLVKLDLTDNTMLVSARSQLGQVKEDIELNNSIENPLSIAFNGKYLLDSLNAIEDDFVKLNFNSPVSPCIVSGVNDSTGKYLVLPVRLTR